MDDTTNLTSLAWQDAIDKLPDIRTWADWGEVFLDIPTWAPLVHEICARAHLPCHSIKSGYPGSNAVFVISDRNRRATAVVKIYAPFCHEDYAFEREINTLLEHVPEMGAPRLLAHGRLESSTAWPYVVLSFVSGEPIREVREEIADSNLLDIAKDLGQRLRRLHAVPLGKLNGLDATRGTWQSFTQQQTARTVATLRRETALPDRLIDRIPEFVRKVLDEQGTPELVLVSGDVTEDHVMLQRYGDIWTIAGLIDFADARVAPREYEWIALWFSALDREILSMQAFMKGYDRSQNVDETFRRRAMAYTFLHQFGALIISQVLSPKKARRLETIGDLQAELWPPD